MREKKIILSPSLLACDFSKVAEQLKILENIDINYLHLDVMDGIFVPNISFGQPIIKSLRKVTKMIFDVHLMITEPERYIDDFIKSGADIITIHAESTKNIIETLVKIKKNGIKAGISIKPNTKPEEIFDFLPYCDLILIMTVEPGFGGQKFMSEVVYKISKINCELERIMHNADIEVDGGIDADTAKICVLAGANILVAGSSVFGKPDIAKAALEIIGNA
ncbi:MAG: ribulose-phosphate 3-epimerase [Clostridia bacterium]